MPLEMMQYLWRSRYTCISTWTLRCAKLSQDHSKRYFHIWKYLRSKFKGHTCDLVELMLSLCQNLSFGVDNDNDHPLRNPCVISYCPSHVLVQSNFWRYYSPRSLEGLRRTLVPNFIKIRQRVKDFPIDPHCKNCPISATL